jgi:hypothetical protein
MGGSENLALDEMRGRRSAERRALVVKMRPSDAPPRRLLRPWDLTSERGHEPKPVIQAGFRPPFARLVQPLKAAPLSGHGRLPKAPRVCVCETQPRAPHPTGSGYPLPAKLSLCPTSGSPLEAPPREQDGAIISARGRAGIGIHSHFREGRFPGFRAPDAAQRTRVRALRGPEYTLRSSRSGALQSRGPTPQRHGRALTRPSISFAKTLSEV